LTVEKNSVFVAPLSDSTFTLFSELSTIPIGIDCHSIISVSGTTPSITPYDNFALLLHFDRSPSDCARLCTKTKRVAAFAKYLLCNRGPPAFMAFLRILPDLFDFVFLETLRSSAPELRKSLFAELGSALQYFTLLASATTENYQTQVIRFVPDGSAPPAKPGLAASFLPFLIEETSATVYLPASLFCLELSHDSTDAISAILPILAPLIGRATAVDVSVVNCAGGLELEVTVYSELRELLEAVVAQCTLDLLLQRFLPELALWLCNATNVAFADVLRVNAALQGQFSIAELVGRLREAHIRNSAALADGFARGGWRRWRVGTLIAAGMTADARKCIEEDPEIGVDVAGLLVLIG
jgi:hypothetical protein